MSEEQPPARAHAGPPPGYAGPPRTYTGPAYAGLPPGVAAPTRMTGIVRATRILILALPVLAVLWSAAAAVLADGEASEAAGRAFAAWSFTLPMAVCALLFGRGRRGVQIATYVFAGLSVLWGFGSLRQHSLGGGLVMCAGIAVFVLLGQTSAAIWFRRPPSASR
jgi:hypothetical protein